jgi:hypothetical protein
MEIATRFENYEDCLMGVGQAYNNSFFVYDKEKIINKIMDVGGFTYQQALEFFDCNININYGRRGPVYFSTMNQIDV